MIDIVADNGWLATTLRIMHLVQMCVQGRWISDDSIMILPHFNYSRFAHLKQALVKSSLLGISKLAKFSSLPEFLTLYQLNENVINSEITKMFGNHHHKVRSYLHAISQH